MVVLPPVMTSPSSFIALHSSALDSGLISSVIKDPARLPTCLVVILSVGIGILAAVFVLIIMESLRQRNKACQTTKQTTTSASEYTTLESSTRVHAVYTVISLLTSLIVCSFVIANTVDLIRSIFTEHRIRWINRQKAVFLLEGIREVHEVDVPSNNLEVFRRQLILARLEIDARLHAICNHYKN